MIRTRHGTVYHERRQREMPYIPSQTGPRERPFRVRRPLTGGRGTGCARDEGDGGSAWQAMASNPRSSNGNARRKLRRWLASQQLPCAICGQPIDYSLPARHPLSFEVDEVRPVSRWREFGYDSPTAAALDRANVQPAHRICNERKGNGRGKAVVRAPIVTSRPR